MGRDGLPGGGRVRDGEDEPHRASEALRQRDALELSSPQLGLEVSKATLNLYEHRLIDTGEKLVRLSAIGRTRQRNLVADAPRGFFL